MAGRENFQQQLQAIKDQLLGMGTRVSEVLNETHVAFREADLIKMESIIQDDHFINELEHQLNDSVTLLITKQQPVATDLRKLIVTLKISSDLERVGDLAVDMAKAARRLDDSTLTEIKDKMLKMFHLAEQMIEESLKAYDDSDAMLAQRIASLDDHVDRMYGEIIKELFEMNSGEVGVNQITQLAFIGRYIERIADYATNITEWVIYELNGKHFDLN
ncbi:phosphate starvation-inducible protein PhoH [Alkalihalobacillus alcalophilus ATCC 27647 = CGMCC 1.3604]|uniref:Phosphate-specific transport system accessory protein PhoU n=1 Tax=Alkalihalobacillus alcalophilus ATCC 27647 = CGMCC 1.3604 TaxID=1218173 RepID=A0A094WLJ4_ALKAL|nr:phosphate signaling complex protein PhoU [Alkalihalobacillus alcalophilus]KGA96788.1 phosphate starvation-inducible protein PhoH [Alkalihalobacillus alcalophilus ATCC 27647 = CGMCC 1.3604]MED1564327.1 phosphate signaling complex protein PhoU [Alkalihalobacillus alcalophilus]THG90199.1 phosphate starvation-inducible protein PhoH [Alkalihalobacillus alcalophilus ATCC 27647 = CGMCC 1.3604]